MQNVHHLSQPESRSPLFFFIYVSSAVHPMAHDELIDLLEESRAWNTTREITGILLYKDGFFMQMLEGNEGDVRLLVSRIARDPRHVLMTPLLEGFEKERHYPDWTMAFIDLTSDEVWSLPGYSPFLNLPLTREVFAVEPTGVQKLMLTFKTYLGSPL